MTIIANYIPLQEPAGGPNFYKFDDDVRYEINVDNDGDGKRRHHLPVPLHDQAVRRTGDRRSSTTPARSTRSTTRPGSSAELQRRRELDDGDVATALGSDSATAPANIGPRSTPNYADLAATGVTAARQRQQGLRRPARRPVLRRPRLDLRPGRPAAVQRSAPAPARPTASGVDGVAGYNINTIAIQVPDHELTRDGKSADDPSRSSASGRAPAARAVRVLDEGRHATPTAGRGSRSRGWAIRSSTRSIIPRRPQGLLERRPSPRTTSSSRSTTRSPSSPASSICSTRASRTLATTGRTDLSLILLQGVPTVNDMPGDLFADYLRLNTAIPPCKDDTATDNLGKCRAIGVFFNGTDAAADLAAFPNGRRLEDDVTDIEIRAVAQGYGPLLNSLFSLPNLSPNNIVRRRGRQERRYAAPVELPVHRAPARRRRARPPQPASLVPDARRRWGSAVDPTGTQAPGPSRDGPGASRSVTRRRAAWPRERRVPVRVPRLWGEPVDRVPPDP